jgi:hypothetical protein
MRIGPCSSCRPLQPPRRADIRRRTGIDGEDACHRALHEGLPRTRGRALEIVCGATVLAG